MSRARPGRLARVGPPAGAGRWGLVSDVLETSDRLNATASVHAVAAQLLERHGVVTREAVLAEGVVGGFANVYPVLRLMEEKGQVRRGYFIDGLGAAQFAVAGAVDQLRSTRDRLASLSHHDSDARVAVIAATDPAQPFGSAIDWPESDGRPTRVASALVVLREGVPLAWFDHRSHHLCTFGHPSDTFVVALTELVKNGELRNLEIRKVNGVPIDDAPEITEHLASAGFVQSYKGWVYR